MGSWSSGVDAARAEARDGYRTAAILGMLVLAWGSLSLSRGPALPFWPIRGGYLLQLALAVTGLLFFQRTWHRPAVQVARAFVAIQTLLWLVLVSATCWTWSLSGHSQDATIGVQVALLAIPLIVPRGLISGVMLVGLFSIETIVIALRVSATEVPRIVPIEPYITLIFAVHAVIQLVLRDRQRKMALRFGLLAAEEAALEEIGPRLTSAGADLDTHLRRLALATEQLGKTGSGAMHRALSRLSAVHARMDGIAREASRAAPVSADVWEKRVRARDGQMSAFASGIFVLASAVLALSSLSEQPREAAIAVGSFGSAACIVLTYLVSMRKRPSERGAMIATTILFLVVLAGVTYVHWSFSIFGPLHRPFRPFVGHKLLAASIGTIGQPRTRRVPFLMTLAMAGALFFYFVGFNPPVQVPTIEPWATLLFGALGLGYLHLREQRRQTTVSLLHAEAAIRSLRRRALLFFAVRDQLNSPLQTLVLGLARIESTADNVEAQIEARSAVEGLMALANDLARLQDTLPSESPSSLDASDELRPRLIALRESTAR